MATDNSLLIEQLLPDNTTAEIDPADVRAVAHALDNQVPNQRRGGPFLVSYLTHAAAVAAGQPTAASLDQLEAGLLCLGATARVAQHPDQAGQWLVLVFDATATVGAGADGAGPVTTGLPVALDGNFQLTVPGKWVKLGSSEATTANVPAYAGNVVYALGYLVRYGLPGGREWFYYALASGQLPPPVPGQTSASWRIIPPPVAETLLYQYLTLDEAQGIEGNGVVAGRRYGVAHRWNASATDQVVYLDGLENYFRRRGTVVQDDGSQVEVEVNVALGTYVTAGATYTAGPGIAITGGVISTTGNSLASYQVSGAKRQQVAYANQALLPEPDEQYLGKQFYDEVTLPGSLYWFRCTAFPTASGTTVLRWLAQLIGAVGVLSQSGNPDLPQLEPWPTQPWQVGVQSGGGTYYKVPAIPGALSLSMWLALDSYVSAGFIIDLRESGGGYWYSGENGATNFATPVWRGSAINSYGFSNLLGGTFGKLYLQPLAGVNMAGGFTLLGRYTNGDSCGPHRLARVRVYGRTWSSDEQRDSRGPGPADSVLAEYDLADLSGGILRDVSGNGYHGQVVGTLPTAL